MKERVAIIGLGETKQSYLKPEVNAEEMVNEAVRKAVEDAQLSMKDIDAVVSGNIEFLEGHYQADCQFADGFGAWMKSGLAIQTGGCTGGSLVVAGTMLVASGVFNKVLVIGWQKMDATPFTGAINTTREPIYDRHLNVGAAAFLAARGIRYMEETGCPEEIASLSRALVSEGASRNPNTHISRRLTVEEVMKSRVIVWPVRFYHLAPTSCGAAALILANESEAKRAVRRPVWIKDFVVIHRETSVYRGGAVEVSPSPDAVEKAATSLFKRNGIVNPRKEIDVWETYSPSSWYDMFDMERRHIAEQGQAWRLIEKELTRFDREIPWNPSGGVVCSNPIGASGMLRVLQAALQIRGEAGGHQVPREVKLAQADAYGGTHWSVFFLLSKYLS